MVNSSGTMERAGTDASDDSSTESNYTLKKKCTAYWLAEVFMLPLE